MANSVSIDLSRKEEVTEHSSSL